MKKLGLMFLVALLLSASLFVSCGGDSKKADAAKAAAGKAAGTVDIKVLNYHDLTTANSADSLQVIWGGFQKANPEIIVTREDLYNEPFHEKTAAYAATGNLPDVVYAWPGGRSTSLHENHLLKDLGPLVKRDGLDKVYSSQALDVTQQAAGYLAMIPSTVTSSHAWFINLEVLNALGLKPATTYAELKDQAAKLKAAGKEAVLMDNRDDWVMQSCLFSMVAGRFGGTGWEKKISEGKAKFTDPAFVNALTFIETLYKDGIISRDSLNSTYGSSRGRFANGEAAYFIDGDWATGAFLTDKSTGQALIPVDRQKNFIISVFPSIPGEVVAKSTSTTMGTGYGISAKLADGSPELEAAWTLVKYLTGPEVQAYQLETGAIGVPVNTKVDMSKLGFEPLMESRVNMTSQYDASTCVLDAYFDASVAAVCNQGLQEIGLGSKTPKQVAAEVQAAYDAL